MTDSKQKKHFSIIAAVILILLAVSFVPIFPKQVQNGTIKTNAWNKIMTLLGMKYID